MPPSPSSRTILYLPPSSSLPGSRILVTVHLPPLRTADRPKLSEQAGIKKVALSSDERRRAGVLEGAAIERVWDELEIAANPSQPPEPEHGSTQTFQKIAGISVCILVQLTAVSAAGSGGAEPTRARN